MARTMKDQAYFEGLLTTIALRFSGFEEGPDLPVPEEGTIRGWMYWAMGDSPRVMEIESTSVGHRNVGSSCGSQGGRALYSTKLKALRALRVAVERDCARRLRDIDIQIEKEKS
jgi:hypothetical protein